MVYGAPNPIRFRGSLEEVLRYIGPGRPITDEENRPRKPVGLSVGLPAVFEGLWSLFVPIRAAALIAG